MQTGEERRAAVAEMAGAAPNDTRPKDTELRGARLVWRQPRLTNCT
jgi:hypothetical protein